MVLGGCNWCLQHFHFSSPYMNIWAKFCFRLESRAGHTICFAIRGHLWVKAPAMDCPLQIHMLKPWPFMWQCLEIGSSVQFSCSVMTDFLRPHGLQHVRPPCPSPTPGVYSNSCPLSRWCHPTTSSSVVPFSSRLLSFPSSGSFQMGQFFTSGGQSIGVSTSASVLPMNFRTDFL